MELKDLLTRIDELQLEINKARPLKPDVERRIMDKFRLDWNYHSNAIEGNKLTLGETKAFLLEGLTADGKPMKDHLDIRGHDNVIAFLEQFVHKKEEMREIDIRELHKMLLHEPYQTRAETPEGVITSKWVKLGEYKTDPNFVKTASGAMKQFALPEDTPAKMRDLIEWFRRETKEKSLHPIILASEFHHQFTQIHPFDDGNGRLARILMNLILMQYGLLPVVIKIQNRDQYIAALVKADVGEKENLYALIAQNEIFSQELYLKGANGDDISDFDDVDKRISLLKKELQQIEKPVELSRPIQTELISQYISPFILRFALKVCQFDELFASHSVNISGNATIVGAPGSNMYWSAKQSQNIESMLNELGSRVQENSFFQAITISFQWSDFQRAKLNTFGYAIQFQYTFEKYRYQMQVFQTGTSNAREETNVYNYRPNEDQIQFLIKNLAEAFLKFVEQQAKAKN